MNGALQIAVDLEQAEVRLGSERVRLLPVAGDVFCLNDARGPLVRALNFEERSRLVADAAEQDVATRIADAALVSSGVAADAVRVAVSLALAGGGENAPSFSECVRFVEQKYGWDEKRVGETMAIVIDRLCSDAGGQGQQEPNGWKQIVFQKTDVDLGTLISQMASNLSQRAVTGSASNVTLEPEVSQTQTRHQSSSAQPSLSSNADSFEPQQASSSSSSSHGSMESVSSVLPVKRAPFRVLKVNTDRTTPAEKSEIVVAKSEQVVTARTKSQQTAMSTDATNSPPVPLFTSSTTIPTTPQNADFPTILNPQPNHANFSLSQSTAVSAKIEPTIIHSPVATLPGWQPFATSSSSTTQRSSEPTHTNPRSFGVDNTYSHSSHDWLAELAQLLEAECDLRGIDP